MLVVNPHLRIPLRELAFRFARSSKPGGQNVNKLSTKAILRWRVTTSPSMSEGVRARLLRKYRRRVTREGELIITSQRFRDQGRNVADCLEKLRILLATVAQAPVLRKRTKPSGSALKRRLESKRHRSGKKRMRRPPTVDE